MKIMNTVSKIFICFSILFNANLLAQKKPHNNLSIGNIYAVKSRASYEKIKIINDASETIKEFLLRSTKELQQPNSGLKLIYDKISPVGRHYTFQQLYNNIPVFNATIKASVDKEKSIYLIINETVDLFFLNAATINSQVARLNKTTFIKNFVSAKFKSPVGYKNEINICTTKSNEAFAVQKFEISSSNKEGGFDLLSLVDEKGSILFQKDQRLYLRSRAPFAAGDSITVSVFYPNPATSAHVAAGIGAYVDNNDADDAILNANRVNKKVEATLTNGIYSLENKYVIMKDLSSPSNAPPTQANPIFSFTRNQKQFEETNAFYHITSMQTYIQSLGFTNICNFQTPVDAHGIDQDQSYFTPGANTLTIGDGCIDDGEDADVLVHEYGHACSFSANAGNNNNSDRGSLDEGFGDYQAASYRRQIDDYDWGFVFPWDGGSEGECGGWAGRRCDRTKVYPADLATDIHLNGEIWASAMMSIWTILGKTTTDKLMYQSLYDWTDNMTMPDAAQLIITADNNLNGGINYSILCAEFKKYGLFAGNCGSGINDNYTTNSNLKILNSSGFAFANENLTIILPSIEQKINLEVFDVAGKKIFQAERENTNTIVLKPTDFEKGFYLINVKANNKNYSGKIVLLH
jgi:Zn-dependent metalloprotease